MKYLTTFFLSIVLFQFAAGQIEGNKSTSLIREDINDIESIYIGLYADIQIDCSAETSFLEIQAEENLLPFIERSVKDGELRLGQIEWIQPTQRIIIRIGAPKLISVEQSTHDLVRILNIESPQFYVNANVGTIELQGVTQTLQIANKLGTIDANNLETDEVRLNVTGRGTVQLATPRLITGSVVKEGKVYFGDPVEATGTEVNAKGPVSDRSTRKVENELPNRFIDLKIKNNTWKRINAYVVGPKPDGNFFSYGFPMRPGQTRKENWTIGSKVYRMTALGTKKLLVKITEQDEGQVVKLYSKDN